MKKSTLLMVVVVTLFVSACSSYTCPTYSKAPQTKEVKPSRI
ncbi:MAG: hypothetical protein ACK498_12760 [Cyclobacteriaceae bacterium]